MRLEAQQRLNYYIEQLCSSKPIDWPDAIDLSNLDLTDEDIQLLWDAITKNPRAAQQIFYLYLGDNRLTSFSGEGLGKLERLELSNNQLTSFSGKGLGALQALSLKGNQLTNFSSEGLGALKWLALKDNQLTSFSGKGLGALQELYINDNQLTSFSGKGLGALWWLELSNNQLTSFSGEGLGALKWLYLNRNQLTSFSGKGLRALKSIYLDDNQLTHFSGKGFGGLKSLCIRSNQLTSFSGKGLGELQRLYLNSNQLTSFSCKGMWALERLDLTNNQLTNICKIMLENMRNMRDNLNYLQYNYPRAHANQELTKQMLTEHVKALFNSIKKQLNSTKSWLSMIRRGGLPDYMCRMVFEFIYGQQQNRLAEELDSIKRALPGQAENVLIFEESSKFARIKAKYHRYVNSVYEDSFKDARGMQTLLSSYRQHRETSYFRYLQENTRLDPRDNPFQLTPYQRHLVP